MSRPFTLLSANGAQIIPIPGGQTGSLTILLAFSAAPSAGTVTIEKQLIGSSSWSSIQFATAASISSGAITVKTDGEIGALRVTFASLVGGTSPTLWLSSTAISNPSGDLLTDGGFGPNRRLRVDVAQTGFFAGREFRTFKEWTVATTATYVIKAVVPVNIILFNLSISLDEGSARIETLAGGTEGGVFGETLPIFGRNTMSDRPAPFYAPVVVLTAGGTLTGGTLLDPLRAKTDANTNQAFSVGASNGDERGVGLGTYYFRVTLTGAIGVFKAWWEERPGA